MGRVLSAFIAAGLSASVSFAAEKDPLQIIVSLKNQHLSVYRGGQQIAESNISSGKPGHDSPTGIFSVLQKNRHHRSNIYSNAPMPYMQRLTWSGIALHASNSVPAYPASHGCIRLPNRFARKLFSLDTRGAHVIIEEEATKPLPVSHSTLFQPKTTWHQNRDYDRWVNEHIRHRNAGFVTGRTDLPVRILVTRRTHKDDLREVQRLLNHLGYEAGEVDGLMGPMTWAAITAFQNARKEKADGQINNVLIDALYEQAGETRPPNGRVLVRQHQQPLYEAEISIRDADQPLGSHLLTVSNFDAENQTTDWLSVSLNDRVHRKIHLKNGSQMDETTARRSVMQALQRLEMDAKTREQISRLLTPGSSVSISDNGLSIETGAKGTDFIVLTKPRQNDGLVAEKVVVKNSG